MLPILHVNGFKIANPTIYKAMSNEELTKLFEGFGWHPLIVEGEDLDADLARALDTAHDEIRELQAACRGGERPERPTWPMIIVRSLKGWTGIKELGGVEVEGRAKSHQVPAAAAKSDEAHLKALEEWLRSYRPDELFDESGAPVPGDPRRLPDRRPAHGREPARERRQAAQAAQPARAREARRRGDRRREPRARARSSSSASTSPTSSA